MSPSNIQEETTKLADELNSIESKIKSEENKVGKLDTKYIQELYKIRDNLKTRLDVLTSYSNFS